MAYTRETAIAGITRLWCFSTPAAFKQKPGFITSPSTQASRKTGAPDDLDHQANGRTTRFALKGILKC